jgi:Transcriptional regulators of sugar metabolism
LTGSSRDTARRDIIQLTDNNLAERNYGGISLPNSFKRLDSYLDRSDDFVKAKRQLAKRAAQFTDEALQIYLDVSTTVEFIPSLLLIRTFFQ